MTGNISHSRCQRRGLRAEREARAERLRQCGEAVEDAAALVSDCKPGTAAQMALAAEPERHWMNFETDKPAASETADRHHRFPEAAVGWEALAVIVGALIEQHARREQ